MDTDTTRSTHQAILAEVGSSARSKGSLVPKRCSICRTRSWTAHFTLEEPAEAPEPKQSWVLCQACHAAVLLELQHSLLRSSVRLRVATGLVAAERWPRIRRLSDEQETRLWTVFLLCGFAGFMLIHLTIMLLIVRP